MSLRIDVNKDVLNWAIKESQTPIDYIEMKKPIIIKWLKGERKPTFLQLEDASRFLKIPFGYFFLETPPKENGFKVEFRTLNNKINNEYSKNLRDTILEMDYRRDFMSTFKQDNRYDPISFKYEIDLNNHIKSVNNLHKELNIPEGWYKDYKSVDEAFEYIRKRIESIGLLVMISGVVGTNNNRTLDINEFRAFVLKDKYSPLIFLNRNDTKTAMIFSLLHEFVHLMIDNENDDIFIETNNQTAKERNINAIVASFLVPKEALDIEFQKDKSDILKIESLAKELRTSTTVVAIRAFNLGYITKDVQDEVIRLAKYHFNLSKEKRKKGGGDFYLTIKSRMSSDYYTTIIHQTESGKIPFTEAFRLLSLTGKTYDKFKKGLGLKLYE